MEISRGDVITESQGGTKTDGKNAKMQTTTNHHHHYHFTAPGGILYIALAFLAPSPGALAFNKLVHQRCAIN